MYHFTEVLNDLIDYFILGDIVLLDQWKQEKGLSDRLAAEFTTNESGDQAVREGIVLPMNGIENYPYTIVFTLSDAAPELLKPENRLQLRRGGYSLRVEHNSLVLFTWRILENFTTDNVAALLNHYRTHHRPMIEVANGWYSVDILGGEMLVESDYEPTFEFILRKTDQQETTGGDGGGPFTLVQTPCTRKT